MYKEKSYFRTQNGSLAICHIEVATIGSMSLRNRSYNMAVPLSTCTMEKQRNVISFFFFFGQRV